MNRDGALRIVLALVGLAHVGLGLIANVAPPEMLQKAVSLFYGAKVALTDQSHHLIRILGAFMIGVGFMAFLACRDPRRNRAILFGIVVILLLRVIQRVVWMEDITGAFRIATLHVWIQAGFFLLTALALLALRPRPTATARE
jgi:hypothetical protein